MLKIVLTGGPCAGKTTAINAINKYFTEKNINIITTPETATELILNGLKFKPTKLIEFQTLVLLKQISKEIIDDRYIKEVGDDENYIIIYDRGILDNKAYIPNKKDFTKLLNDLGLSEIEVVDKYDIVIDMLSTATCKKQAYNLENAARSESIEEAIKLDKRTTEAWTLHRNLKIINSSMPINEEIKIIINIINEALENKQIHEIKKFYLNDYESDYSKYNENNSETLYVTEYNFNDDEKQHTIYKREHKNGISYIYNIYKEENGQKIVYLDKKITQQEFFDLLKNNDIISTKEKKEIQFIENNQKYSICFYDTYTTLEIDENKLNDKLIIPNNLKISDNQEIKNKHEKIKRKVK